MKKRISTYSETSAILERYGLAAKKGLGQNFIIEPNIISRIVAAAEIDEHDLVLEVGPGLGALTQGLAENAGRAVALELDDTLIEPLRNDILKDYDNVVIYHTDVMRADIPSIVKEEIAHIAEPRDGFIVAANLPYYITTPIMMLFLESELPWRRLVFMMQKEVADRLNAKPSSKAYGALTVAVNYRAAVTKSFIVPPTVFYPRPGVDSAVVVLERLPKPPVELLSEKVFFNVVRAAFGQRRKTLLNALSAGLNIEKTAVTEILQQSGIEANRRGETLSAEEFAIIADNVYRFLNNSEK